MKKIIIIVCSLFLTSNAMDNQKSLTKMVINEVKILIENDEDQIITVDFHFVGTSVQEILNQIKMQMQDFDISDYTLRLVHDNRDLDPYYFITTADIREARQFNNSYSLCLTRGAACSKKERYVIQTLLGNRIIIQRNGLLSVQKIKEAIEIQTGSPVELQVLTFDGLILNPDEIVSPITDIQLTVFDDAYKAKKYRQNLKRMQKHFEFQDRTEKKLEVRSAPELRELPSKPPEKKVRSLSIEPIISVQKPRVRRRARTGLSKTPQPPIRIRRRKTNSTSTKYQGRKSTQLEKSW